MNMDMDVINKKRCIIVGLGQTGLSCARYLTEQDMDVVVMDTRETPPALSVLQDELPQVLIKTGGLDKAWLDKADMIVLSPGVDPRQKEIQQARDKGIEIVGDIELFARAANAPIVAITGSNGKSTVTTLLSLMAQLSGKNVKVGGNLGTPALELLSEPAPDFYIVELSSFQLETVSSLNAFVATVLNVSADHLDRYDAVDDYVQAKQRIFNGDGVMVINQDDPVVAAMQCDNRNTIGFSLHASHGVDFGLMMHEGEQYLAEGEYPLMPVSKMKLAGKHNVANVLASLAIGSAMALPMTQMLSAVEVFRGLSHRCALVTETGGVRWYNDSKATNVGAAVAAIEGLTEQGPIVLIAGGDGKGQQFDELTAVFERAVKAVVLIGDAAKVIAAVTPSSVMTAYASDMVDAVKRAAALAVNGDNVLLSPACASFDMFKGYADRGEQFEQAVRGLSNE